MMVDTAHQPAAAPLHQAVELRRVGEVLVLVIDSPPVNALGHALRAGLEAGITAAEADPGVRAVVIRALGRTFPAGADIAEFGQPPRPPLLPDLCNRIEACRKPVIAALHGTTLGGGLEVALAAHGRVALASTRLGLPEVHLGILPGAGATQRLPRLTGAAEALRMMIGGRPIGAAEGLSLGLLDKVVEDGLEEAAIAMARAAIGQNMRRTRDRRDGMLDPQTYQAAVAAARKAQAGARLPGPARIVDCVEAALLLPFEQGLAFERAAFVELVASDEAGGLRHVFFAERRATKVPEARATAVQLATVGILGADEAAADLALALIHAGYAVTLVVEDEAALVAALERIAARQEAEIEAGRLTRAVRDADWARLHPALGTGALGGAELVFVLPGEAMEADRGDPQLSVAFGGNAPGLALHLPGDGGRLAEVVVPDGTNPATVAALLALARKLGRVAVRSSVPGGIGARLMVAGRQAAAHLVVQGVDPGRLRKAMAGFGFDALVAHLPATQGAGLAMPLAEIVARCLGAMANDALRILAEGGALRPSDIDLALVLGQGFPRWEGGPMLWAERRGLLVLRRDLREWAGNAPALYTPAALMDDLIREGRSLAGLNAGHSRPEPS